MHIDSGEWCLSDFTKVKLQLPWRLVNQEFLKDWIETNKIK